MAGGGSICSVATCKSSSKTAKKNGEHVIFFCFPKDPAINKEWVKRCCRGDSFSAHNKFVCSKHFKPEDFADIVKAAIMDTRPKKLKKGVIPTLLLPSSMESQEFSPSKEAIEVETLMETPLQECPMMLSCVVYGCTNNSITSDSSIKYHPFPKNAFAQQWAEACGWQSNTLDLDTACICSIHFDETAYDSEIKMVDYVACYCNTLKQDAVPTLYLPQTQIVIKDNSVELEDGIVVYTINSSNSNDGITTISLEDGTGGKQIFELQPSTDEVKVETQINSLKNEIHDPNKKYDSIKSYPDLYVLQANNKSLKTKIEVLEEELVALRKQLTEKESEYTNYDREYKDMETQIINNSNKNIFTQQEQRAILAKVFSEAQIKILLGKKKVYWSNDDMAVGYTIRHLSNRRCYSYLTKKLNIPLPGVSSMKRWVAVKDTKRIRS